MQTIQAFCIISLIVSLAYAVPTAPDKWTANVVGHEFRNNINTTFNGVWAQDTQGGLSYESGTRFVSTQFTSAFYPTTTSMCDNEKFLSARWNDTRCTVYCCYGAWDRVDDTQVDPFEPECEGCVIYQYFTWLPKAVSAGTCESNHVSGDLWLAYFEDIEFYYYYCFNEDTPLYFKFVDEAGTTEKMMTFTNFQAGTPPSTLFDLPSECSCSAPEMKRMF